MIERKKYNMSKPYLMNDFRVDGLLMCVWQSTKRYIWFLQLDRLSTRIDLKLHNQTLSIDPLRIYIHRQVELLHLKLLYSYLLSSVEKIIFHRQVTCTNSLYNPESSCLLTFTTKTATLQWLCRYGSLCSLYLATRVDERLRKLSGSHFVKRHPGNKRLRDELLNNNAARDDDPC